MSQGQGFSLFKTHCNASGIEHATTGNFTSPTDNNLIVAKSNVIEIYILPETSSETSAQSDTKLLLVARYRLFGEIQDIKTARFVPNYSDSLLITFPDAKLSVIDFDESQRNIITRALFNFDELYRRIGNITSSHLLTIRVDPLQRCAALRISHDLLFILPLFDKYLKMHKLKKGSNSINIVFKDTLSNEHQQEIEREERRVNGDPNDNHNRNNNARNRNNNPRRKGRNDHRYISPIPSRNNNNVNANEEKDDNDKSEESVELEDIDYIEAMKSLVHCAYKIQSLHQLQLL